jgi:CheY-like chemotaxis protein
VLDRLKQDPTTRDIPVHIISVFDDGAERAMELGAETYLAKPVGRDALRGLFVRIQTFIEGGGRRILVIEDDPVQRRHIVETLTEHEPEVEVMEAATGKEALATLKKEPIDCVVLDIGLPDIDGRRLIGQIHKIAGRADVPIVVYTAADLSTTSRTSLLKGAKSVITKTPESNTRLIEEVGSFLGRIKTGQTVDAGVPAIAAAVGMRRQPEAPTPNGGGALAGRKILVVDDDVRNIFALTALLERHGVEVLHAETGREALQLVHENPSLEAILMDIMMPEMDGFETMSAIRRIAGRESLPIIAVTAKAMKGDRERCLEAGASDYLSKPIDGQELVAVLESWIAA